MHPDESQLHKPTRPTGRARLRARNAIARLDHDPASRVLAPEHERKHGRLNDARLNKYESVSSSAVQVTKHRSVLLRPRADLFFDRPQNQSRVEINTRHSPNALDARDGSDLLEIERLAGQVVQQHLLLPAVHCASHCTPPFSSAPAS
jgi:hypothetical protein